MQEKTAIANGAPGNEAIDRQEDGMTARHFQMDSALLAAEALRLGTIDRRQFLAALAAAGAIVVAGSRAGLAAADEIVICNWGGAAVEKFTQGFVTPFTKATGIKAGI